MGWYDSLGSRGNDAMEQGQGTGWVGIFLASAGLFLVLYVGTLLFGYWLAR
jgi:hypothetical protein